MPVAVDDATLTLEEGGNTVTGNVMGNDTEGADGAEVTSFTYTDETGAEQTGAVGVEVNTQYGALTVQADGSFTYTSDAGETHTDGAPLLDAFTYTITDGDGDTSSATQAFEITDDGPQPPVPMPPPGTEPPPPGEPPVGSEDPDHPELGVNAGRVDEDDLTDGSDADKEPTTVTGTLTIDAGDDGLGSVAFTDSGLMPTLTSGGVPVTLTPSTDGQTITGTADGVPVFTMELTDGGTGYSFTLQGTLDQPVGEGENEIDLPFTVEVTDGDGSTASTTFHISVVDDVPTAIDDSAGPVEEGQSVSGNVVDANDTVGADGASVTSVEYTDGSGNTVSYTVDPVTGATITVDTGVLTIAADGSYTFTTGDDAVTGSESVFENFTYTLTDGDGDQDTAVLSIEVTDDDVPTVTIEYPGANATAGVVNEDDLGSEDGDGASGSDQSGASSVSGTIGIDTGDDGFGSIALTVPQALEDMALTSGGEAISYSVSTDGQTITAMADGSQVFTVSVTGNEADGFGWTFDLTGQIDHPTGDGANVISGLPFGVTVTDADGDATDATIKVDVIDDVPVALTDAIVVGQADSVSVDEDDLADGTDGSDTTSVSGNLGFGSGDVIAIDYGADGAADGAPSGVSYGDLDFTINGPAGLTSQGKEIGYSQTGNVLTATSEDGRDVFTVTLNGDGSYTFNLMDSLDHADGAGENAMDLGFTITGTPNADVLAAAVDGDGDAVSGLSDASVTQSFSVSVVDDVPVATANDLTGEPEVVTVTITAENYSETGAGFTVTGRQIDSNGTLTDKSTDLVSTHANPPGFGVTGAASGDNSEIGYSDSDMISEELHIDFDQPITEVTISYSWMNSHEDGTYTLYRDGQPVGSATVTGVTDQVDAAFTAQADDGGSFDSIVFTAPSGGGNDFLVHSVEFEQTVDGTGGVVSEVVTVDEDDLPDGSDLDKEPLTASGDLGLNGEELISIDYGADGAAPGAPSSLGYADLTFTIEGPEGLTSQGEEITYSQTGDVMTASADGRDVFTVTLNADGSFTFTLMDTIDHQTADGENVSTLSFGLSGVPSETAVTDYDLDPADLGDVTFNHSFQVNVIDDVPQAVDDATVTLNEGGAVVEGSVMDNDTQGADGASVTEIGYTDANGNPATATVDPVNGASVATEFGTLTIAADGSYTFTSNTSVENPNGAAVSDGFTYTITDADGDTATATQTFAIEDTLPELSLQIGPAEGLEDQPIALSIAADLAQANGAVTIGVQLGNVPTDATLVTGTGQVLTGSASYTLTPDELEGLTIQAGEHSADDFAITVTATATHSVTGETVTTDAMPLPVTVHEVADGPTLTVDADVVATGDEGTDDHLVGGDGSDTLQGGAGDDVIEGEGGNDLLIGDTYDGTMSAALNIDVGLIDQDGSEVAGLTLSGLPAGATLTSDTGSITVTANGTAELTAADLEGLTVTFPAGTEGFDIAVAARTVDTDFDDNTTDTSADVIQTISVSLPAGDGFGDDTIIGGEGDDTIYGNRGDDVLHGDGPDVPEIELVTGTQTIYVTDRGPSIDIGGIGGSSGSGDQGELTEPDHVSEGGFTITGTLDVAQGGVVTSINYTAEGGQTAYATVDSTNGVTVDTQYGSLTVNADGSFSYTSDQDEDHAPNGDPLPDPFSFTSAVSAGSTSGTGTPGGNLGSGDNDFVDSNDNNHNGTSGSDTFVVDRDLRMNENFQMGDGDDVIVVNGNTSQGNNLNMGGGDDAVMLSENIGGNTAMDGGNGNDVLYLGKDRDSYQLQNFTDNQGHINTQIIDLDTGNMLTVNNIEAISFADGVIIGNADLVETGGGEPIDIGTYNDTIYGEEGNDQLYGDQGNDVLRGGEGDDTVDGGTGIDDVHAGSGNDSGIFTVGEGGVGERYDGGTGTDTLTIRYSAADLENPAIVAELREIQDFIANNSNPLTDAGAERTFQALGITVQDWEDVTLEGPDLPPPVDAQDDGTETLAEGGESTSGNLLSNDETGGGEITQFTYTDEGGDTQTAAAGETVDTIYGTLTVNADGSYTYTSDPSEDHSGGGLSETVTYTLENEYGSDTASITLNVTDTVPVAQDDANSTVEGGDAVTGNLLTNDDLGADGSSLTSFTYTDANGAQQTSAANQTVVTQTGSLTVNADGSYSFTANDSVVHSTDGETEQEVFTYTITDGDGDTSMATATIDITDTDPTLEVAASGTGVEDQVIPLDLSYDVTGEDVASSSFTISGVPEGASLTVGTQTSPGVWSLTAAELETAGLNPPHDFSGDIDLTLTASVTDVDGDVATDSQDFTVYVAPVVDEIELTAESETATFVPKNGGGEPEPGEGIRVTNMGHESASYNNTFGYVIMVAGVPTVGEILFSNTKQEINVTKEIEGVDPDSVEFFVISNGASLNPGLTSGTEVTFSQNAQGNWVASTANGPLSGQGDPVIFSNPALNENNYDYTTDNQVVGNQNWEDIANGGDMDFNDVNMNVERYEIPAGTGENEVLVGTPQDDVLDGGAGDDTITGLGGDDTITGGTGNDTIYGDGENDGTTTIVTVGDPSVVFFSSFEDIPDNAEQSNPSTFADSIDGWRSTADKVEIWTDEDVRDLGNQPDGTNQAADGDNFVELNNVPGNTFADADGIYRDVQTVAGEVYELTFSYSGRPGYDETVNAMEITVDGEQLGSYSQDMSNQTQHDWQTVTVRFVGTGEPMRIVFAENSTNDQHDGRGMSLDDITLVDTGTMEVAGLEGESFNDTIYGNAGDDTIYGQQGDDLIFGDNAAGTLAEGCFVAPIEITAAATDTDGSEEVLTIEIGNIPDGATLTNAAGDTFTGSQVHVLTPDQLAGLQIEVPNGTGDFSLSVEVTVLDTDPDQGGTDTGTRSTTLAIDIPEPVTSDGNATYDDTIYGGAGSDTISGQQGNDVLYGDGGPDDTGTGNQPVEVEFDLSTPSYSDDPLNQYGSSGDHYAKGYMDDDQMVVKLGGKDDCGVCDMAGGFTSNFSVDAAASGTTITFSYRMIVDQDYESDEFGEVWVAIDGQRIDINGNDFVTRVFGNGNGGGDSDTGWQTVTLDVGDLPAGDHQITLGGYNNAKTTESESIEIRFDDLEVSGTVGGVEPVDPPVSQPVEVEFDLSTPSYSDDPLNQYSSSGDHYAKGYMDDDQMVVKLGGKDDCDITDMSGGFTSNFSVDAAATETTITFSYRMIVDDDFESNEFGEVWVAIDGQRIDINGDDFVTRVFGNGNGGGDSDTGWQTVTVNVGDLPAGDHQITLGGYNNAKTTESESVEIRFDNLEVSGMVGGVEPVDPAESLSLDITGTDIDTSDVVATWHDAGVTLQALRYDPSTDSYSDRNFSTKDISFTINGSNTSDTSLHGSYNYAGISVGGGIDGGEIDTIDGQTTTGTEVMRMTFDEPMGEVSVTVSALFDGETQITADHGPYDPGYLEQARWTAFGPDGQQATGVIDGTVNGLASATITAGFPITSIELTPMNDGAGNSGHNSDFLLKAVSAQPYEAPSIDSDNNDTIHGGSGDDQVFGQYGNDFLQGGSGNDIVSGGAGRDWIMGGSDAGSVDVGPQSLTVTFQGTDASYSNSVGYYVLDDEGTPETGQVIWANLHQTDVGSTHTILLDGFDKEDIGFFLIPDGADINQGLADGTVVTFGESATGEITIFADGQELQGQDAKAYFSNPSSLNSDGQDHTQVTEITDGVGLTINSDGKDGYLQGGGDVISGQQVTVEVGFKATEQASNFTPLVSYSAGRNNGNEFTIGAQNGTIQVMIAGVAVVTTILASGLFDGQEHMISATWDGASGDLKVYVDGVQGFAANNVATGQSLNSGGTLVFGQEQDSDGGGFDQDQVFSGTLTQARIFDEVRDPVEIAQNAGEPLPDDTDHVTADYHFGSYNAGNQTVEDVSGNGNHLTYQTVSGFAPSGDPEVIVGGSGETLIGFEDLINGGDQDYNDAILSVKPVPSAADFHQGDQLWGGDVGGTGDGEHDAFFYARGDGVDTINDFEVGTDQLFISGYEQDDMTILQDGDDTIISLGDGGAIKLVGVDASVFGAEDNIASYDADTDQDGSLNIDELMQMKDDVLGDSGGDTGGATPPPSAHDAGIVMIAPVIPGLTDNNSNEDPQNG